MDIQSFRRIEQKYLLNKDDYSNLIMALKGSIVKNKYGNSTILNIYFDTTDFLLARNSIQKPIYKEKVRLRSYNIPKLNDDVFLEIKKKYDGVVSKSRIKIKLEDMYKYLNNNFEYEKNTLKNGEIEYTFKKYNLRPAMFVGYERDAYEGVYDKNLRVTFDSNLRYRKEDLKLDLGDCGKKFFDEDIYIMEIKTLDAIPLWFCSILSDLKIYPISFSKYGEIYKRVKKGIKGENLCLQAF